MSVVGTFSPESQCDGKRQFRNKRLAKIAARRAETLMGGGHLDSYRCPHCGWFHNGHRPPRPVDSARVES